MAGRLLNNSKNLEKVTPPIPHGAVLIGDGSMFNPCPELRRRKSRQVLS